MTYEEAVAKAKQLGGTLDWSPEQDWFVTGGKVLPWWQDPSRGGLHLGWLPGQWGEIPKPQVSWVAQQELTPEEITALQQAGFGLSTGTRVQIGGAEDEAAYVSYVSQGQALLAQGWITQEEILPTIEEWVTAGKPAAPKITGGALPKPLTYAEAQAMVEQLGPDYYIDYDEDTGGYTVQRAPFQAAPSQFEIEQTEWERRWAETELASEEASQAAELAYYRERDAAQLEADRQQRLAQLAAQPMSWLQYAAESGQQPAIQPWMLPLMPQQYSQLQAGGAIPGYQGTAGMTQMPELLRPSAQLQARWGPTAQQQYYGYQQAQQASMPQETQFRRWSEAPPSGSFRGLSYRR